MEQTKLAVDGIWFVLYYAPFPSLLNAGTASATALFEFAQ